MGTLIYAACLFLLVAAPNWARKVEIPMEPACMSVVTTSGASVVCSVTNAHRADVADMFAEAKRDIARKTQASMLATDAAGSALFARLTARPRVNCTRVAWITNRDYSNFVAVGGLS